MLSDDAVKVVRLILDELNSGTRTLPTEISLGHIERMTGVSAQNIGMAFDDSIKTVLEASGFHAVKIGTPRRIRISKLD